MWPPEAIEFLRDLEANNDRDWFKANRERYDVFLMEPARELAAGLADLGLAIGYGSAGGYYVELSLDGLLVAGGLHHPASDQLARYRAAIDDGRRAAAFERALKIATDAGLEPGPPGLKRAPRGYPLDHPRLHRLRMKELTVYRRRPVGAWLHKRSADKRIREELESARPLVTWLGKHVGPATGG